MITIAVFAVTLSTSAVAAPPVGNTDGAAFQRLAMCQDAWVDWKGDNARMTAYVDRFKTRFTRAAGESAFVPVAPVKVLGFPVVKVYPQSLGTSVGFSLVLDAPLAKVRAELERATGKTLECSESEGTLYCGAPLDDGKTLTLSSGDHGQARQSLLGCAYHYEN